MISIMNPLHSQSAAAMLVHLRSLFDAGVQALSQRCLEDGRLSAISTTTARRVS